MCGLIALFDCSVRVVHIQVALVPVVRWLVNAFRPLFINAEYLSQERLLQQRMEHAKTYPEWKKAASELDRLQGRYHWKESSQSLHYDWRRIRDDLQRFRELVDTQDVRGIMAFSRSRLLRNLVGINDRRLYSHLRAGTKRLIEEYISEVVRALQLVCMVDSPGTMPQPQQQGPDCDEGEGVAAQPCANLPSTAEKLSFFNETRHAFGRSALLLSGGATLGLYHIGVMKALHDNNLLPRVISGSSVGSIICAMVGTRTDDELTELFSPVSNAIKLNFFVRHKKRTARRRWKVCDNLCVADAFMLSKSRFFCSVLCVSSSASQRWQCETQIYSPLHSRRVDGHQNSQEVRFARSALGTRVCRASATICWS